MTMMMMMVATGQRQRRHFLTVCCYWCLLLLAVAPFHCVAASKVNVPFGDRSLAVSTTSSSTTTQQLHQLQEQHKQQEDAVVVLDLLSTQQQRRRRRRLQADDDGPAGNNNKPHDDSNENEPIEEEEEEEEEEEDMPPPPIYYENDPVENEEEKEETNDFMDNVGQDEREEEEEIQDDLNEPPEYQEEEVEEEEEEDYNENNELEQDQYDEYDQNQDNSFEGSGETPEGGDDFVNPQQPPPVRFQRPGADKARAYRTTDILTSTPEIRAKLQKRLIDYNTTRRHGFLKRGKNQQPQQPPLRRPGQGQTTAAMPENPRHGATDTMLAYQPGTKEFMQRREEVLKKVELKVGKHAAKALALKWEQMDQRRAQNAGVSGGPVKGRNTPFTKALPKPKLVEKVPVVKRFVKKMGYEEALMLDTTMSFLTGLRHGVYKSSGPLTLTKKQALADWFEFLSISLPQEWGIHEILDDFHDNIDAISQKESSLMALVDKHHPSSRYTWSPSCQGKASMSGFACGFWKLLHVSTIGLAEHRGGNGLIESGIRNSKTRTFTPKEAADTMKNYIQHFYLCGDCAKKFVAEYNDCNLFSRCNRLADDSSVTDDDWKEVGKWLWEVHNHINANVLLERKEKEQKQRFGGARVAAEYDVIAALWPTVDMCSQCFNGDGSWDEEAVFLYLERTFWPPSVLDPQSARLLKFEDEFDPQGTGLTMILAFVGLILVVVMRQSLLSKKSLDHTIIMARQAGKAMVTKGSVGAKKRAV